MVSTCIFISGWLSSCPKLDHRLCPFLDHFIIPLTGHGKALIAIAKRLLTAIYYMLLRDELYNPVIGKDVAPERGKISLEKLIEHYNLKGYTIVAGTGKALFTVNTDRDVFDKKITA